MRRCGCKWLRQLQPRSAVGAPKASTVKGHGGLIYQRRQQSHATDIRIIGGGEVDNMTLAATNAKRKVFCNVELNGEHIDAVGFDMDFTLAQVNKI
jgi:hypothetical protein